MVAWYLLALVKKRADLADIAWGSGFVLVSWISFGLSKYSGLSLMVNLFVTLWAIRLGLHLYFRNANRPDDFRYKAMKQSKLQLFFQVFMMQGCILYIVALPIFWIHAHPKGGSWDLLWIAIPLWIIGFLVETFADLQLLAFKKQSRNKGKLLTTGLWDYSRHPNLLGELSQWWAIWILAASMPHGWMFIASPLLLTFLIVKVSGIAPLENKMKHHPDFPAYAQTVPPLIPTSTLNGIIYTCGWIACVYFGAKGPFFLPLISAALCYALQLLLFSRWSHKSLLVCIPLSVYAVILAFIQETAFIHFHVLSYPGDPTYPPLWILYLYPLFSLTLNSSFSMLNNNLLYAFLVGGIGATFSYISGEKLHAVHLYPPYTYIVILFSWGTLLSILVLFNRKLLALYEKYKAPEKEITVFFDKNCPVCFREMNSLKKRKHTGPVNYVCPTSDQEIAPYTKSLSYKQAMKKIHAIDDNGKTMTGTKALSAVYARAGLPMLAVLLQAPGFKWIFKVLYAIWAFLRIRK